MALLPRSLTAGVLSIAHRGNSFFAPENTRAAFEACRGIADMVEFDVHVTADGALVVMHDATVNRTTDGEGRVNDLTLAELQMLDAGSWFSAAFAGEKIMTLEQALTNILDYAVPLVDHKSGSAQAYVDEFRRLGVTTNLVLQSFDWDFLAEVHDLEPIIPLAALGNVPFIELKLNEALRFGAVAIAWSWNWVNPEMQSMIRDAGLPLFVFTVQDERIAEFIELGVDGIISNDPALVTALQQASDFHPPAQLREGLSAYWPLDDGLDDAFAVSVADRLGASSGTLSFQESESPWITGSTACFGGSLALRGEDTFVALPQTPALDIQTNALTLSAWVRLSDLPSNLPTAFADIYGSASDAYGFYLDRSASALRFVVTDTNQQFALPRIPQADLVLEEWVHLAATYCGAAGPVSGQARIYLNGRLVGVWSGRNNTHPRTGLTGPVFAGQVAALGRAGPEGGNPFDGGVDDVAVWHRALGPGEIRYLYSRGQQGYSLGDLVRQPTELIRVIDMQFTSELTLQITFETLGHWQNFRLLIAQQPTLPFVPVYELTPEAVEHNRYRFEHPIERGGPTYFRIEGH